MWKCVQCGEQIESGFDVCWKCGTNKNSFESEEFNPDLEGVMDDSTYETDIAERRVGNFATLATFWNAPEAHVLRSRLEAEGIHAFVTDELTSTTFFGMGSLAGGVRVQVSEIDFKRAKAIYEQHQHRSQSTDEPDDSVEDA